MAIEKNFKKCNYDCSSYHQEDGASYCDFTPKLRPLTPNQRCIYHFEELQIPFFDDLGYTRQEYQLLEGIVRRPPKCKICKSPKPKSVESSFRNYLSMPPSLDKLIHSISINLDH
jgi:hypothetical protein